MRNPRPLRTGALTLLVFMLVQPLVPALLFAGLTILGAALSGSVGVAADNSLVSLLLGFLIQLPGAGFTGLIMAFASYRIRSTAGWLWWSALAGFGVSFLIILVPLRSIFADGTLLAGGFFAGVAALLTAPGALAAAGATLRLRSRPWLRPAAEVFD